MSDIDVAASSAELGDDPIEMTGESTSIEPLAIGDAEHIDIREIAVDLFEQVDRGSPLINSGRFAGTPALCVAVRR